MGVPFCFFHIYMHVCVNSDALCLPRRPRQGVDVRNYCMHPYSRLFVCLSDSVFATSLLFNFNSLSFLFTLVKTIQAEALSRLRSAIQ